MDKDENVIEIYESTMDAEKITNIDRGVYRNVAITNNLLLVVIFGNMRKRWVKISYNFNIFCYDFEVYSKINWFCVTFINYYNDSDETVIVNNRQELIDFYEKHKNDVFISYNGRQYDTGIWKGLLDGMNVGYVNDKIIKENKKPFQVVKNYRKYQLYDYDAIIKDKSLKVCEAFMGDDIRETEVDFNIDRPLTKRNSANFIL